MNKLIGVVCLVLGLATTVLGQGLYLGPAVGYSSSQTSVKIAGSSVDDVSGGSGPSFGAFLGYGLNPTISIEGGIFYAGESFKTEAEFPVPQQAVAKDSNDDSLKVELEFSYVNIPVVLMAQFPQEGNIRGRARAGLEFGFEAGCTIEVPNVASPSSTTSQDCGDDTGSKTKTTNLSVPFSIGAGLGLGANNNMQLFLDVGYKLGLTNVAATGSEPDQPSTSPGLSIKHNSIFGTLGLAIAI